MGAKMSITPPQIHPSTNKGQNNNGNEKANGDSAFSPIFDVSVIIQIPFRYTNNLIVRYQK